VSAKEVALRRRFMARPENVVDNMRSKTLRVPLLIVCNLPASFLVVGVGAARLHFNTERKPTWTTRQLKSG
jgi:hypothetical protein